MCECKNACLSSNHMFRIKLIPTYTMKEHQQTLDFVQVQQCLHFLSFDPISRYSSQHDTFVVYICKTRATKTGRKTHENLGMGKSAASLPVQFLIQSTRQKHFRKDLFCMVSLTFGGLLMTKSSDRCHQHPHMVRESRPRPGAERHLLLQSLQAKLGFTFHNLLSLALVRNELGTLRDVPRLTSNC